MNSSLIQTINQHITRAGTDGARVASEVAAFTRVVASSNRLAKVLADSDISGDAKSMVIKQLTGSSVHAETVALLSDVASTERSSADAFASLLVDVSAEAAFSVADSKGRLEAVGKELYDFATAVRSNSDLRDVLTNPAISDEAKIVFVGDVLTDKVERSVTDLVQLLIALDHGRDVDDGAKELSKLAAERRDAVVAEVLTAVELDEPRQLKLTEAIGRSVGKNVEPRFIVEPDIVGSVIVRVGDEVFDGSVRHRLDQARNVLVGAPS